MSKYLLMLVEDQSGYANADEATMTAVMAGHQAFAEYAGARRLAGEALQPPATATVLRPSDNGEHSVTDGPFAETKESIGGFYLVEAQDLDEAIDLAKRVPTPFGGIEIRPIMDFG